MATPGQPRRTGSSFSSIAGIAGIAGIAALLAALSTACGGGNGSGISLPDLPAKAELEALAAQPIQPPELHRIVSPIDSWTLSGPFPEMLGPAPLTPSDELDAWLLSQQRAGNGWVASAAMQCLAREMGRVAIVHSGDFDPRLRRFVADACGVVALNVNLQFWEPGPQAVGASAVPTVDSLVRAPLSGYGPGYEAGVWLGTHEGASLLVLATARTSLSASPAARAPDDAGRVRLSGRFDRTVERMLAYITFGPHEVRECDVNAPLPDFSIDCPMADGDETAVIEVLGVEPGRLLGGVALRAMAARPDADLAHYEVEALLPELGDITTTASLVDAINELRARAGQGPLVHELRQSEFQDYMAPHFFAAQLDRSGARDAEVDRMTLGLIAGWDVEAQISGGRMTADWVPGQAGADSWLFAAQRSPTSRHVILDPEASRIAVGTAQWDSPSLLGFIVTTYIDLSRGDPEEEAATVRRTLSEARERAGHSAARRLRHERLEQVVADVAARLESGELAPEDALDEMLDGAGNTVRRGGFGIAFAAQRLDDITFPLTLIEEPTLNIIVGVAQVELPELPWALHVVLLLHIGGAMQERAEVDWRVPLGEPFALATGTHRLLGEAHP